jgi:putative Mg2+ transporter-C (MgtC) family protein
MIASALSQSAFVERLAVATALGLVIGFERQWRQRSAGLHTSTLVAVGAALFVTLPELAGSTDLRVAATVVTGIGFLAGGVILREGFNVRGLITAATLWATAAVGALAGAGFEIEAALGAGVIVAVNVACMPLAEAITRIPRGAGEQLATTYTVHVRCAESARAGVRACILQTIGTTSLSLTTLTSSLPRDGLIDVVAEMTKPGNDDGAADRLQRDIKRIEGVQGANWEAAEHSS